MGGKRVIKLFRKIFLRYGFLLQKSTRRADLQRLFWDLVPMDTEFELVSCGGLNDGSYLVPLDFYDIRGLFSPGVGDSIQFERFLYANCGIRSHLLDASVNQTFDPCIESFEKKYLGGNSKGEFVTLTDWVRKYCSVDGEYILSMDIEGAEYETLMNCDLEILRRFRIIILEFRHVENWSQQEFFKMVRTLINKITTEFYVAHLHPNNCCGTTNIDGFIAPKVFEVTFHKRNRVRSLTPRPTIKHHLDTPNVRGRSDIEWTMTNQCSGK